MTILKAFLSKTKIGLKDSKVDIPESDLSLTQHIIILTLAPFFLFSRISWRDYFFFGPAREQFLSPKVAALVFSASPRP
jgi:hypothetical protein